VSVQAPFPVQAPPHPVNPAPASGVAVNVTAVPWVKLVEQATPQ